jgi:predicted house-cleaning noncanonical NTP pyrophosphatase (MazG superfamily)
LIKYLESGEIEELADLEEVLRAILDSKSVSYEEFERIRKEKVNKRGAFKDRIYLVGLDEKEL